MRSGSSSAPPSAYQKIPPHKDYFLSPSMIQGSLQALKSYFNPHIY